MTKFSVITIASLLAAGVVGMFVFMAFMMTNMMDGRMGMGGDGSDPSSETPAVGVTEVRLEDFAFAPANIVIEPGTTVTWTNHDSVVHTVTSDDGNELESEQFGKDGTFSHTFDAPGDYSYHCEPHPNMQGLMTVRARARVDAGGLGSG